uniref:Uncharacterized protein n=1 Tax=Clytia hemisphaerica TaxID=252671 RepID=A0A7M5X619_9CNID
MDRDSPVGAKQSTVSLKTTDIIPIKYFVNFSDYQTESFFPLDEFGIIGWPIKGVVPGLSAFVYAHFDYGFHYRSKVDDSEFQIRMRLDKISGKIEHDIDDPSAVFFKLTPQSL